MSHPSMQQRAVGFVFCVGLFVCGTADPTAAETVTGRATFRDGDQLARPIADATVEVWRLRPRGGGGWSWGVDQTLSTDAQGEFSTWLPWVANHTRTRVRIYATNPAVRVYEENTPLPYASFASDPGGLIERVTANPYDGLDFTTALDDPHASNHFNIADAIRTARAYADAHRVRRDSILQSHVFVESGVYSRFDGAIRLASSHAMDDAAVLHYFAHQLVAQIGAGTRIISVHDGCTATVNGADAMTPQLAFLEGFADYFPHAVRLAHPGLVNGADTGATPDAARIESPACPVIDRPRSSIEIFVAAALFDLVDPVSAAEPDDVHCVPGVFPIGGSRDAAWGIFYFMDHGAATLEDLFMEAAAYGVDLPVLDQTLSTHGWTLSSGGAIPPYGHGPAANLAVWHPPTATSDSRWEVQGGASLLTRLFPAGGTAVPADYDGDGRTDPSVYSSYGAHGDWWVYKSATNGYEGRPLGLVGDLPLPGDYDGDLEDDHAVYRPATGEIIVDADNCGTDVVQFIGFGAPYVSDIDGDGRDEAGVFGNGNFVGSHVPGGAVYWDALGSGTDLVPVVRDYDGDGLDDLAQFEPKSATWEIRLTRTGTLAKHVWGDLDATPVPADYDGDGHADLATWKQAVWTILQSKSGQPRVETFGNPTGIPVPR